MLINTINCHEEYFKNFDLISFLDTFDIYLKPWECKPVGKDDSWGVELCYRDGLQADIYFLNEGLLYHSALHKEVGPTSKFLEETDKEKLLIEHGLLHKRFFAKQVELEIKQKILVEYDAKRHLNTLKYYSDVGKSKFAKQAMLTSIFEKGTPINFLIDTKEETFKIWFAESSICYEFKDLKTFAILLNFHQNIFFKKDFYTMRFYNPDEIHGNDFDCKFIDVSRYLFELYRFTY